MGTDSLLGEPAFSPSRRNNAWRLAWFSLMVIGCAPTRRSTKSSKLRLQTSSPIAFPIVAPGKSHTWRDVLSSPWLPAGGALLFGWLGLWNKLRVDWTINEQYEYGWFVPPLALAVLALRWKDRPAAETASRPGGWLFITVAVIGLLMILPLRLIEGPNPDWRLIYWLHAGTLAGLSLALATWSGGWRGGRHFAFPILFLLVAVPWPSGPEQAVVQSLMRGVAAIAAECMAVLGIPAVAEGNVLSVRGQLVGVNEACSGIRSLQTTLMAGLFLGELSRLTAARRLALLGGGVLIALAANIFRSSFLVWVAARSGVAALERYHDATGISVLFIVFGCLLWLNARLAKRPAVPAGDVSARGQTVFAPALPPRWIVLLAVGWFAAMEVGNLWWYSAPGSGGLVALPRWTVAPPADAGFEATPIDERTARLLRYDRGVSLRWNRSDASTRRDDCTLFFFRWEPGHASNLQADLHQPHICLTASGLKQTADWGIHPLTLPDGLTLPVRRYEFENHGRLLYVFFVGGQDGVSGRAGEAEDAGARAARLRAVLERRPIVGRQTLEFLVSGPASPEEANSVCERELAALIRRVAD